MKTRLSIALPVAMGLLLAGALAGCKKDEPEAEPSGEPSSLSSAQSDEAVLQQSVSGWITANYEDMGKLLYASAESDLDGDGTPEVLAYVGGPMMCGTGGCNLVVLKREGGDLRKISELSVVQLPAAWRSTRCACSSTARAIPATRRSLRRRRPTRSGPC